MQVQVSFQLYKVAIGYFVGSSILLLAILYFMAPDTVGYSAVTFTNLVLGSAFMILSSADTLVIPKQYRIGLRTLATMLMFANIDTALCDTHTFVKSGTLYPDEKARGALRFSAVVIVINSIGVFLATYFGRVVVLSSLSSVSVSIILQRLLRFLCVVMLVFAQILAWSMTNMCRPISPSLRFPAFETIGYALLLTAGSIYSDREAFDYALIMITNYVFTAQLVFDSSLSDPEQSAFQGLWQANVWLRFVAGILIGLSVLAEILGNHGLSFTPTNVLSVRGATQVVCMVLGLAGSICIYAKAPSGIQWEQANWNFSFAWFVPFLQLLFLLTDLDYLRGVVLILSFPILGELGYSVLYSVTSIGYGYINAGMVMCFFAAYAAIVLDVVLQRPFGLRPIDEYFGEDFPTTAGGTKTLSTAKAGEVSRKFFTVSSVLVYLSASTFNSATGGTESARFLLAAFFMLLGNECKFPDLHRILFFQAVPSVFSKSLWPLFTTTSAQTFLLFFILFWFAFHYIYRYAEPSLQMVTGEREYESEAPFLAANAQGATGYGSSSGYQRVPSDGPNERTTLVDVKHQSNRSSSAEARASNQAGGDGAYQAPPADEEHHSGKFDA
jgi:hypothetical protein